MALGKLRRRADELILHKKTVRLGRSRHYILHNSVPKSVQFKENIALVLKYLDKLPLLIQEQGPAD
jgi:hypothetical protein